jgi:hypothetical protein
MQHSESIAHIAAAYTSAQSEFESVRKDADNPYFNSKYADITSILDMLKPILTKHELAIMQLPIPSDHGAGIQTVLMHSSGEWIADEGLHMVAAKQDPQGYGGSMTYGRRYALLSFFSLATEDDDGNAAVAAVSKAELARQAAAARRSG